MMIRFRQREFGVLESLAGRKKFYHGTSEENAQSILEEGLSGEKAKGNRASEHLKLLNDRDLVYITPNKKYADKFARKGVKI